MIKKLLIFILFVICLSVLVLSSQHPVHPSFSSADNRVSLFDDGFSVSDDLIYKVGHYSVNGTEWVSFEFDENIIEGTNWIRSSVTKNFPQQLKERGMHYLAIYSCTFESNNWNCHDNKWQLSTINNTVDDSLDLCEGVDCDDGNSCTINECNLGECITTEIVNCINDDGCCPSGCDFTNDNDCETVVFTDAFEAEDGVITGDMAVQSESLANPACNDAWVEVPVSEGVSDFFWQVSNPSLPPHRSELDVELPFNDTYYVWLRVASSSGSNDAAYAGFQVDDLRRIYPSSSYPFDLSWSWISEVDDDVQRLVFEDMLAGDYDFIVGHAESGLRIDKIVISNDLNADFNQSCGSISEDVCGDGQITGDEVCDTQGPLLGGATCVSEGYEGGGELGCAEDCQSFEYSNCVDSSVDCRGMREYDWSNLPDGTIQSTYFSDDHWGLNIHYDPDSISVTSSSNKLREPESKSLRFYINPTDPPPPSDGDDGNLRAEIHEAYLFTEDKTVSWGPRKPLKSEEWISWSYYFPSDFVAGDTASTKFLQCHVGNGAAPIDLRTWNPDNYPNIDDRCPGDTCDEFVLTRLWPDDNSHGESIITDFKPPQGEWVDFVLHVIWDTESGGDGLTEFWVNGVKYEGTPGATTFDDPYGGGSEPYGGMVKLGMYHGSWRYQDSIDASLAEGVEDLEIFMGPVRILSRVQGDHIGSEGYSCVAPRGPRP